MNSSKAALVTGASSGIGMAFARLLAEEGYDLILTARREKRLSALARELEAEHGVRAVWIVADLADPDAPSELYMGVDRLGMSVDLLVNNAGYGIHGDFHAATHETNADMLQVLVSSLTELTSLFLPAMLERKQGGVINVASVGAEVPNPGFSVYGAAKAYVVQFTNSLNLELAGSGVTATTVLPAATSTEFMDVAGVKGSPMLEKVSMTPEKVAEIGYRAFVKGKVKVVTGCLNRFQVCMLNAVPRCLVKRIVTMYLK